MAGSRNGSKPTRTNGAGKVSGNAGKLKKLAELKNVNKEIKSRFQVSKKLFQRKDKLMSQLGMNIEEHD